MSIDDAIYCLKARSDHFPQTCEECQYYSSDSSCENEVCDMAIRSLEMQKKLAEFRGTDICRWSEDYDYEETNISEYEFEASVEDFLIDEAKEEVDKNDD